MKALSSRNPSSRRRKIIILVVALALIGVGVGAFYLVKSNQEAQEKQKVLDRDKKAAKTDGSAKKTATTKDKNSNNGLPENSTNITTDQVPTSSALSVSITSASQVNGMVNASAKTSGDGTCVFLYSAGDKDKPVTRQVSVGGNSCGTSISQNEFSYIGQWKLTVTYYSGGSKTEASQNVTIH